jgi:hypothetical protein
MVAGIAASVVLALSDRRGTQDFIDIGWRTYVVPLTFAAGTLGARVLYGRATGAFERATWLHNTARVR